MFRTNLETWRSQTNLETIAMQSCIDDQQVVVRLLTYAIKTKQNACTVSHASLARYCRCHMPCVEVGHRILCVALSVSLSFSVSLCPHLTKTVPRKCYIKASQKALRCHSDVSSMRYDCPIPPKCLLNGLCSSYVSSMRCMPYRCPSYVHSKR